MSEHFNTVDIVPDAKWLEPLSVGLSSEDSSYRDFLTPSNDYGPWGNVTPPNIELNLWE